MSVAAILTTTIPNSNSSKCPADKGEALELLKKLKKPSDLQRKLEEQLQKSRQVKANTSARTLYNDKVHTKQETTSLVSETNSEEEFEDINLKNHDDEVVIFKQPLHASPRVFSDYSSDCTDQLLRDGYRLDELSDDEDLDLIPPRPSGSTWCACDNYSCNIQ